MCKLILIRERVSFEGLRNLAGFVRAGYEFDPVWLSRLEKQNTFKK